MFDHPETLSTLTQTLSGTTLILTMSHTPDWNQTLARHTFGTGAQRDGLCLQGAAAGGANRVPDPREHARRVILHHDPEVACLAATGTA